VTNKYTILSLGFHKGTAFLAKVSRIFLTLRAVPLIVFFYVAEFAVASWTGLVCARIRHHDVHLLLHTIATDIFANDVLNAFRTKPFPSAFCANIFFFILDRSTARRAVVS
jgi:hypothetical protein